MFPHANHTTSETTRREFVLAGIGVLASGSLLLAACGGSDDGSSPDAATAAAPEATSTEPAGGPWTFTDDRGVGISLPALPLRIVAQEDAAAALWPLGVRPVGVFGNAPLGDNPQFEGVDLSEVESVGSVYGEINLEKLAALKPDLIVTPSWQPYGASGMGFKDDQQLDAVSRIAPIAAIEVTVAYADMVDRFHELAESLGVDVAAPDVTAARDELEAALEGLRAAVAGKPGLEVLAVSANADQVYVADPGGYSDLQEYHAAGIDVVVPKANIDFGWETLSWERVDKYAADIILYDGRAGTLTPEELAKRPTWARLPAVEAGQIGPWYVGTTYSLPFFTEHVKELTALIERSQLLERAA